MIARNPWPSAAPTFLEGRLLRGPNVHHESTVYAQPFAPGSLAGVTTKDLSPEFVERVLQRFGDLESLDPHGCLRPGLREDLMGSVGVTLVDLLLELTLAVERSVAAAMRRLHAPHFGRVDWTRESADGSVLLVWESWSGGISRVAARAALAGIVELLPSGTAPDSAEDFEKLMAWLRKRSRRRQWAASTAVLAHAARRRGVPHEALAGNYLRLGDGHLQQVIAGLSSASPESGAVESSQEPFDGAGKRRLYQLLVVDGALVSSLRIDAPRVVGDGTRTLAELIGRLDSEPRRRAPFLRRVRVDESLRSALAASGWRLEDVPPAGVEIALEAIRDLEDGAVPCEVTGEVHPFNERLAIEEAAKRGFPIAAVHILISNIARSGNRGFARVWRVDPEPDVFLHSVAGSESLDRVSVKVLDALYPPGLPSRIPIALVLGERGTIRIARDLERFLRVARRGVAMSTRTHTTILGRPVERLSTSAGDGPEHLLSDPRVDSLVHAVSPRRVVGRGLRLDHVSVTAVVEPAKTSRRTRREALRVAIEATTGPVCIGIDDPDAERLLAGVQSGRVIMVASRQSHPRVTSHLEAGGAVVLPRLESSEPAIELRRRGVPAERIPLSLLRVGSGPVDGSLLGRLLWTAALAFGLGVTGPPPPPAEDEEDSRLRLPTASRETPGAS